MRMKSIAQASRPSAVAQVIQSATASEADEKTRGLVSAMVVEIDAKYEKWFVERFEDAVDDIEKEVAELESELAEF